MLNGGNKPTNPESWANRAFLKTTTVAHKPLSKMLPFGIYRL